MTRDTAYYRNVLAKWSGDDRMVVLIGRIQNSILLARDDAELAAEVRAAVAAYEELAAEPAT